MEYILCSDYENKYLLPSYENIHKKLVQVGTCDKLRENIKLSSGSEESLNTINLKEIFHVAGNGGTFGRCYSYFSE